MSNQKHYPNYKTSFKHYIESFLLSPQCNYYSYSHTYKCIQFFMQIVCADCFCDDILKVFPISFEMYKWDEIPFFSPLLSALLCLFTWVIAFWFLLMISLVSVMNKVTMEKTFSFNSFYPLHFAVVSWFSVEICRSGKEWEMTSMFQESPM